MTIAINRSYHGQIELQVGILSTALHYKIALSGNKVAQLTSCPNVGSYAGEDERKTLPPNIG